MILDMIKNGSVDNLTIVLAYPFSNTENYMEHDISNLKIAGYDRAYLFGGNQFLCKDECYRISRHHVVDVTAKTLLSQLRERICTYSQEIDS